jgi:hypothetical protein
VTGHTGTSAAEALAQAIRLPLLYKPLGSAALRGSLSSLLSTKEE